MGCSYSHMVDDVKVVRINNYPCMVDVYRAKFNIGDITFQGVINSACKSNGIIYYTVEGKNEWIKESEIL